MIVYLHCEGVTDYAVMSILIKKASNIPYIDIQWIKRDELNNFRLHRKKGAYLNSHYRYVTALAGISLKNGIKYIAYHQDADGKYSEVYDAITTRFQLLKENDFHCLAIVPKEMTESWLLADVKAINSLGDGSKNINQSPTPESINDPKTYLKQNLAEIGVESNSITYAQIAENADIDVIKTRCPESFGQFCTDMQSFIIQENTP